MRRQLAVFLLAACAADPCPAAGEPRLALGGSDTSGAGGFEAFADGADRELVSGAQGGMHVWLQARITGLCPDTTTLERRALDDASGQVLHYARGTVELVEDGDGFELARALPIILCPPVEPEGVVDRRLRFTAVAVDGQARRAEAEIALVPRCPAGVDCDAYCAP